MAASAPCCRSRRQVAPHERGDAARNRALLLDAARRLIAERGADAVTMDDIAAAAGVGKGTLFRRFGSRAGLMIVLLDEDEKIEQQAFMFGPPPLGPGAPPLERLLAYGRDRLRFVHTTTRCCPTPIVTRKCDSTRRRSCTTRHVRVLLEEAGTTGDLDAQADALLALLDADYVHHQLTDRGETLENSATSGRAWRASSAARDHQMDPARRP